MMSDLRSGGRRRPGLH